MRGAIGVGRADGNVAVGTRGFNLELQCFNLHCRLSLAGLGYRFGGRQTVPGKSREIVRSSCTCRPQGLGARHTGCRRNKLRMPLGLIWVIHQL